MKKMKTEAWMAGFFDGEGCILVHRTGRSVAGTLVITINNTHPKALRSFARAFGGRAHRNQWQDPRKIKDMWRWSVSGIRAIRALEIMMPYLLVKKPEARVALRFFNKKLSFESADSRLRFLKRKAA